MVISDIEEKRCSYHPNVLTRLRCSKCGNPICPQCMVTTPVGMRCRECAQIRRLPQFDVSPVLLLRSGGAGLLTSCVVWSLVSLVPYLRFFLSIFVGLAVGEVMSRLSRRRDNRWLEVTAVACIVLGFAVSQALLLQGDIGFLVATFASIPGYAVSALIPIVIAAYVAIVKLR